VAWLIGVSSGAEDLMEPTGDAASVATASPNLSATSSISPASDTLFLARLRLVLRSGKGAAGGSDERVIPTASPDSGTVLRIGRYEILGELGQGGFGTVLLARDPSLLVERAMKVPNPETLASSSAMARFVEEGQKAVRVEHSNVVRVLDADTAGPICFIVMEYCPEGSLAGWLAHRPADRPIPPRWAAALMAEIADGVQAAHSLGILHRDLKPGNILLVRSGVDASTDIPSFRPKVSDFGLAKVLDEAGATIGGETPGGVALGTRGYMSPEQFRGDRPVREASDIYSLGVILFELLTRRRPYSGPAGDAPAGRLLDDSPPPSLRSIRSDIPRELETICRACLAKAPGDRYRSAANLADDLRKFLRGDPVQGSPWWKRARANLHRHRAAVLMGVGMVVLASGLGAMIETANRNKARSWLIRMGNASLRDLPALIAERDPPDGRVKIPLGDMFERGNPSQKRAAAVALAGSRPECEKFACEQILTASADEIRFLVQALKGRARSLEAILQEVARTPTNALRLTAREQGDIGRANASAALVLLDRPDLGLPLLRFAPDPQARTFLIHTLGPAGVSPKAILDQLERESDPGISRAMILSLGEIPDEAWRGQQRRAAEMVLSLYEGHPDSGIHGAAKWLLARWQRRPTAEFDLARRLPVVDKRLLRRPRDQHDLWRLNPVGRLTLTLITVELPALARRVEIADTETSLELFKEFRASHLNDLEIGPDSDSPANRIMPADALEFCEWLGDQEGIEAKERCHVRDSKSGLLDTVPGWTRKSGYRLMTVQEFEFAARSGTTTTRYLGDSPRFLDRYVQFARGDSPRVTVPVTDLKPNDLGFFGLLGNADDMVLDETETQADLRIRLGGGSSQAPVPNIRVMCTKPGVGLTWIKQFVGFRVARTVATKTRAKANPA